jgi:hypothetical protein
LSELETFAPGLLQTSTGVMVMLILHFTISSFFFQSLETGGSEESERS